MPYENSNSRHKFPHEPCEIQGWLGRVERNKEVENAMAQMITKDPELLNAVLNFVKKELSENK